MNVIDQNARLDSAKRGLSIAAGWEKKRDYCWAQRVYGSVAMQYFSIVAGRCPTMHSAQELMHQLSLVNILQKTHQMEDQWSKHPVSASSGCEVNAYKTVNFSQISCILGDFDLGRQFMLTARSDPVYEWTTPFWREYIDAYTRLWEGRIYRKPMLLTRPGLETSWVPYLELLEGATQGQPLEPHLANIDKAFKSRNADSKIKDDNFQIEGTPYYPIAWDWRRDALMVIIGHKQKK